MSRNKRKQTRRGNGEGSIYKSKDRWCGQVTVGYDERGKPVRKTYYGNTREEVAKKVTAVSNQVFNGSIVAKVPKDLTVEKMITDFLWTFKKPTVSDVTFEWYLNLTNAHITPAIGDVLVHEMTPYMIQTCINQMYAGKKLAVRTIKGTRDILNQAYTHAIEMKLATMNPVSGTKLPRQSRVQAEEREDMKVIPVADRSKILKATEKDIRMRVAITTLMFSGIRRRMVGNDLGAS